MKVRGVVPYPVRGMKKEIKRQPTICSTLRDIYDRIDDPETKLLCRAAVTMAKRMSLALEERRKLLLDMGISVGKTKDTVYK